LGCDVENWNPQTLLIPHSVNRKWCSSSREQFDSVSKVEGRNSIGPRNSTPRFMFKRNGAKHGWLSPIILATQKAEIRKIMVQSQLQQIVQETLS
jgi:hypothetical protein